MTKMAVVRLELLGKKPMYSCRTLRVMGFDFQVSHIVELMDLSH